MDQRLHEELDVLKFFMSHKNYPSTIKTILKKKKNSVPTFLPHIKRNFTKHVLMSYICHSFLHE